MLGRVTADQPVLRLATLADVDAIDAIPGLAHGNYLNYPANKSCFN